MVELVELDAVEQAEEIEMPIGAAKFSVGRELEADLFLFPDDLFDLAILDVLKLRGLIAPFSRLARASCSGLLRRRLPTWSA